MSEGVTQGIACVYRWMVHRGLYIHSGRSELDPAQLRAVPNHVLTPKGHVRGGYTCQRHC